MCDISTIARAHHANSSGGILRRRTRSVVSLHWNRVVGTWKCTRRNGRSDLTSLLVNGELPLVIRISGLRFEGRFTVLKGVPVRLFVILTAAKTNLRHLGWQLDLFTSFTRGRVIARNLYGGGNLKFRCCLILRGIPVRCDDRHLKNRIVRYSFIRFRGHNARPFVNTDSPSLRRRPAFSKCINPRFPHWSILFEDLLKLRIRLHLNCLRCTFEGIGHIGGLRVIRFNSHQQRDLILGAI